MSNIINNREEAAKFIFRATFGPKGSDIDNLVAMGEEAWFDQQFNLEPSLHTPLMRAYSAASYTGKGVEFSKEQRYSAWFNIGITGADQLRQRTAFALSQIFVVGPAPKVFPHYAVEYYDILVRNSFGNVRDILEAITLSPVMGKYLSLANSKKHDPLTNSYPDENFARELMQLFTLGLNKLNMDGSEKLDADGNTIATYSQNDIEELARVLTGWRLDTNITPMKQLTKYHDYDEKVVWGQVFPAGQTGYEDLTQALDFLFNHSNTAIFLSKLLIKRLTISNPTPGYIRRVARVFRDNGFGVRGDMKAIIKAILLDRSLTDGHADSGTETGNSSKKYHFGKAKEPLIVLTNFCRALDVTSNDPSRWWDVFMLSQGGVGQAPLFAESVFNFYEPDYAPEGEFSEKGLTAPEFTLFTMENLINLSNKLWKRIQSWDNDKTTSWSWNKTIHDNAINEPLTYIELINDVFYGGLMSEQLQSYMLNMLDDMTIRGLSDDKKIEEALFVVQCSPEFRCQE